MDLAEVDINDLGKMLNPEENIQKKMKRDGADDLDMKSNLVDMIKREHRMTVPEVL